MCNELLQQIAEHEEAGPQLLHWFNSILREGSLALSLESEKRVPNGPLVSSPVQSR